MLFRAFELGLGGSRNCRTSALGVEVRRTRTPIWTGAHNASSAYYCYAVREEEHVLGGGNSGMTVTRQEMLGFGAAFTDAACYMLNQLHSDERAALRSRSYTGEFLLHILSYSSHGFHVGLTPFPGFEVNAPYFQIGPIKIRIASIGRNILVVLDFTPSQLKPDNSESAFRMPSSTPALNANKAPAHSSGLGTAIGTPLLCDSTRSPFSRCDLNVLVHQVSTSNRIFMPKQAATRGFP